jgi:tRNA (cmo5U34)-methyltransferase
MTDFNFSNIAHKFHQHLKGQLPWYENFMDDFFPEFARYFIKPESIVYDLGASTGGVELRLEDIIESRKVDFRPVESNDAMIKNYLIKDRHVIKADASTLFYDNFSFCSSILCLSFIHPSQRSELIMNLKNSCIHGGGILILEKFQNSAGVIGTIFNRITWRNKIDSKQPLKDIVSKELNLSGVQYPLFEYEVEGFQLVWAYGDFRAYLYVGETS